MSKFKIFWKVTFIINIIVLVFGISFIGISALSNSERETTKVFIASNTWENSSKEITMNTTESTEATTEKITEKEETKATKKTPKKTAKKKTGSKKKKQPVKNNSNTTSYKSYTTRATKQYIPKATEPVEKPTIRATKKATRSEKIYDGELLN